MLTLSNITKTYHQNGKAISVLNGISLHVGTKESVAIMGRSGSGKSTLLSIVSGILRADTGKIELAGKDFAALSQSALSELRAAQIGFIFQNFHLVSYLSALENVMLPGRVNGIADVRERAEKLLDQVGLAARATHLPSQLSGGERQRVAIARSLIHKPHLILADEPSGSLDQSTGEEVVDLLFDLVRESETSLVLVTHDRQIAQRCQKIYYVKNGNLSLEA